MIHEFNCMKCGRKIITEYHENDEYITARCICGYFNELPVPKKNNRFFVGRFRI